MFSGFNEDMKIDCNNSVNHSVSFKSVLPYTVIMDGRECINRKYIVHAINELRNVITRVPESENHKKIINKFWEYMKKEFNPELVKNGTYAKDAGGYFPRMLPKDGYSRGYMAIGNEAVELKEYGYSIGANKKISKAATGKTDSFDVLDAQKGFGWKFYQLIKTQTKRSKDANGKPIELVINMANNKKYGRTTFKSWIESIEFRFAPAVKPKPAGSVQKSVSSVSKTAESAPVNKP